MYRLLFVWEEEKSCKYHQSHQSVMIILSLFFKVRFTHCIDSPGWEVGLLNMCIGERRKLTIPADLAYGEVGAPPDIHAGATLVFDIELIDILDPSEEDDDLSYYEKSHFTEL